MAVPKTQTCAPTTIAKPQSQERRSQVSVFTEAQRGSSGGFTALSALEPVEFVGQLRRHFKSHQGIGVDTEGDSYWLCEGTKSTKQLCLSSISIPSVSLAVLWRNRTNRLCSYAL